MPRPTPIERAIAGEPQDRRRRWDQRMLDAGFKQVKLWVPEERVPLLKELKSQLVDEADYEALLDFVTVSYRAMLEDPECDDLDRQVARQALADLGALPAASAASEDSAHQSDRGRK
jgi:hypothetical protein